jgi:hypothetical protein
MSDDEPRLYSGSIPSLAGCLAAGTVLVLLVVPVLFVWAWSGAHCEPQPGCVRRSHIMVLVELAAVAGIVLLFALGVRAIVRWHMQKRMDARLAGPPPYAAYAAVGLLGLLALWASGEWVLI